jgi:2-methylisocitrate lyase-like PEP mutase family enzyme
VLVGRAENFLHGRPDLDDTIRRLQAFEAVGANALYAPGLTRPQDIRTVCAAVSKPVNVVMGLKTASLSVADLAALGVRRISLGSALSRAALGAFLRAAREIRDHGTFHFAEDATRSFPLRRNPEFRRLLGGAGWIRTSGAARASMGGNSARGWRAIRPDKKHPC